VLEVDSDKDEEEEDEEGEEDDDDDNLRFLLPFRFPTKEDIRTTSAREGDK
jgi:hypothetical protein